MKSAPNPPEIEKEEAPQKILNIIINTFPGTQVKVHHWSLDPSEVGDPERVDIQTDDLCYCTILDPLEPKVETWCVTKNGQIAKQPISTIGLPFVKEISLE